MDGQAESIAKQYEQQGRPAAGNTLDEAVWLEEQGLGYPLNLMCTLYYESTAEDPFRHPAEAAPPSTDSPNADTLNSQDSDE